MKEEKAMKKHYVSINYEPGLSGKLMFKAPLEDALHEAMEKAPESKHDCWLISNGYNDDGGRYLREEHNFKYIDTILLDVDNKDSDPELMNRFMEEYGQYEYMLWETASSTAERPKFRAILMLDDKIEWVNEPEKYTKKAIHNMFSKWTDDNASWFFTPTKGKLDTFIHHDGIEYPSFFITSNVRLMGFQNEMESTRRETFGKIHMRGENGRNSEGWRNLPSVKHCLEGLVKGERDTSLCKACYAMDKNGYRDSIQTFLNEVATVEPSMRRKWLLRYS